jgi:acyl-CoA thioester hydrolase
VGKFDEATWQFLVRIGMTPSSLRAAGTGMVAAEQTISYKRELLAGDTLTIHSRLLEVRTKAIRFTHEMRNDETGEVAATTVLVGVHLDTALRTSRPLPQDVRERLAALVVPLPT